MPRVSVMAMLTLLAACQPTSAVEEQRIAEGRRLIMATGCGACHVIPGIPGAVGKVGPALDGLRDRVYLAGRVPNVPDNLAAWIQDPRAFVPNTIMPPSPLSRTEAQAVTAFLWQK